jgi:uncharacterized protein YecE (DUF72 family)
MTPLRRLREMEAPLANFFAQGILRLGEKLGPFLWQFPPSFQFNSELIKSFFTQLPRTPEEAAEPGRRHEARRKGRTWLDVRNDRQLRHAAGIRNESFVSEDFRCATAQVWDWVGQPGYGEVASANGRPFGRCRLPIGWEGRTACEWVERRGARHVGASSCIVAAGERSGGRKEL